MTWSRTVSVAFLLSTSALAQREVVPETPRTTGAIRGATTHTVHTPIVESAAEPESATTFEVSQDPARVDIEGLSTGTQPVPEYLRGNPYRLSFWGGDYTPPTGQKIDPRLLAARRSGKTKTYGFVMFDGRITAAKLERVRALGVELGDFHTFQSYQAAIPFASLPYLRASKDVRWVGYAQPIQKIDPAILEAIRTAGPQGGGKTELLVSVFASDMTKAARRVVLAKGLASDTASANPGATIDSFTTIPHGPFQKTLEKDGARVFSYSDELRTFSLTTTLTKAIELANHDFVHFVELPKQSRTMHDESMRQIGLDLIRSGSRTNGSSTACGIIDTGAWIRGTANPNGHRDLQKNTVGWSFIGGNYWDDVSGHGTHVLGTFVGTGTVNRAFRGGAPAAGSSSTAKLFIAKAIPGSFTAAVNAIRQLRFSASTSPRPAVVNNSWGSSTVPSTGFYGTDTASREVDTSVYAYGQCHVFAAGNSGGSTNSVYSGRYGRDRWLSVTTPAVAKNALTVANQYKETGTDQLRWNLRPYSLTGTYVANTVQLIQVSPSTTGVPLVVEGFTLRTRSSRAVRVTTYLYRADGAGRPTGSPVATGSMSIGTSTNYYTTTFPRPYTVPAGQRFLIGLRVPASSLGVITSPVTADTAADWGVRYWRPATQTSWNPPSVGRVIFAVNCRVEAGETTGTSSLGPTRDGRLKPNIGAPGQSIVSCRARTTSSYIASSGTSMAAPHVAGVVADMLDATTQKYVPSRAKAILCANANPYGDTLTYVRGSAACYYRNGLGQVDAYKSIYARNDSRGWISGNATLTFTSGHAGAAFDVTVPADADRMMFTLNFDERPGGLGATRACLADLDLYLDIEPIQAGWNTGEFSSRRAWDTWDWLRVSSSLMSRFRGKRVRVKVFPRVRPASGTTARWTVAYCIHRGDPTPAASLSIATPTVVKRNADFAVAATMSVPQALTTNAVVRLSSSSGFDVRRMSTTTPEGLSRTYSGATDWTLGLQGFWFPTAHRTVNWVLRAPRDGRYTVCAELRSDNRVAGATTNAITRCSRTICVDGVPPEKVRSLSSPSHAENRWSRNTTFTGRWFAPLDSGCAGLDGYCTSVSVGAPSSPTRKNLSASTTTQVVPVSPNTRPYYFNVRGIDAAGNLSVNDTHGPFYVDNSQPVMTAVSIAGTYTRSLDVSVSASATDTFSGPVEMSYSANNATWSAWMPYTTTARTIRLSDYGGSTAQGTRAIWVRVRDRAGNVSASRSATIVYDSIAPVIRSVAINSGATHTRSLDAKVEASATETGSGSAVMRYSLNGTTWSTWQPYTTAARGLRLSDYGGNTAQGTKRVRVQVRDRAGNVSGIASDSILYDTAAPVVTSVTINGNAPFTSALSNAVLAVATGEAKELQYSLNGSTWSAWFGYTAGPRTIDFRLYGGNAATGRKVVHVRARDAAGNVGASRTDDITYYPTPNLTAADPATVTVVNESTVRLTGSGFDDVNSISFGSRTITSTNADDWFAGWFRVIDDGRIELHTPQGLAAGSYPIRVRNPGFRSNQIACVVMHNPNRQLGCPEQLAGGKPLHVLVHRGDMPAATVNLLTMSTSPNPIAIPGLVNLGHGGHPALLLDPSFFLLAIPVPHDPTTRVARWTLPSPLRATIYFASIMIDATDPDRRPIPTSTTDRVRVY